MKFYGTHLLSMAVTILGLAASAGGCASWSRPTSPSESVTSAPLHRPARLTRKEAQVRARQIGRVSYVLWFGLDATGEEFEGRAVVNFELRQKAREAGGEIFLELSPSKLRSLSLNDRAIPQPRYDGGRLRFSVSELNAGLNRIELVYARPYSDTGSGLHRFKDPVDGNVYVYTNLEPYHAHDVFPCFDQPDLKASYELTVFAPENWEVVSNTEAREITEADEKKTWAFPPSPVFSTYLFALHAGPYASWKSDADGIPIRLYARKSMARYVDSAEWFEITRAGLDFFATQFGYPYPYSKYDQVLVPDFSGGAMENVGAVTLTEDFIFRSKVGEDERRERANTILHEMAHMWFGNLVTLRWWNGLWLNESFATFMASRAVDEATRFKGDWLSFFAENKRSAYRADQSVNTHPIEVPVKDTDEAESNFDEITYGKGASALKQLFYFVGEEDFREGVQRYFQRHALKNTTLQDFVDMLSEASALNLSRWEKNWLQAEGLNTLFLDWACEEGRISRFNLLQKPDAHGLLREHRTEIGLFHLKDGKVRLRESLPVSYSAATTPVQEAIGKKCPAFVFGNHRDFDYVKLDLEDSAVRFLKEGNLVRIEDALTRQMLWHALWERVRDARMPATEFGELVLTQGVGEKDTRILGSVLSSFVRSRATRASALKFIAPSERGQWLERAERIFRKKLDSAPAGSDLQLAWWDAYLAVARSPTANDWMRGLLAGRKRLSGLRLEPDRRWELLQALAGNGAPEAAGLIEAESLSDPTESGKHAAVLAQAMIPDAAGKKLWFERILRRTEGQTDSVARLRAAMRGFHLLGQEELTRDYAGAYFEALPKIAATGVEPYYSSFSHDLFPAQCDPGIQEQTRTFLAAHEAQLPVAVVRALKSAREEDERCTQARARLNPR